MPLKADVKSIPGAVKHSNVAVMNVSSTGGARNFVTFIDETPGQVRAFHMRLKDEAATLLKRQVMWVK